MLVSSFPCFVWTFRPFLSSISNFPFFFVPFAYEIMGCRGKGDNQEKQGVKS